MNPNAFARRLQREGDRLLRFMGRGTNQYHVLYLLEDKDETPDDLEYPQDEQTGFPVAGEIVVTRIEPPARVMLGGMRQTVAGGAMATIGDAFVTHLRFSLYPLDRLLNARGFKIDDPSDAGDMYHLIADTVRETGHDTMTFALSRLGGVRIGEPVGGF